ncbi:MAG: hypothetical protein PUB59_00940 [Firmicutes bacterium]|nr:hypothetical protein [Bacillota bacterium]
MRKRRFVLLLALSLLLISFCACSQKDDVPEEAKTVYESFVEACKTDCKKAAMYVNFTSEEMRIATEEAAPNVAAYKIKEWIKLDDDLIVVKCWMKSTEGKESERYAFVVRIDGKYLVARNTTEVPVNLKEKHDLAPYTS